MRRWRCGRSPGRGGTAARVHDDARDLIGAVEIHVAVLVAFHHAVELAFADAVARVNLVGHQIGGGFCADLGLTRLREQGVESADFRVEVGEVGGGECSGGGERGEVGRARVENGGSLGEAIGFGLVEQIGRAEIHGVEQFVVVLLVGPGGDCATHDGGDGW